MIEIKINDEDMANVRRMLHGVTEKVPVVVSRAVNKTLNGIKTDAAREITQVINVTQATVKGTITINKSTPATLSAWFRSTGRPLAMTKLIGTRQTAKGVSVKRRKDGPRTIVAGSFIATVKAGNKGATHTGVFWREYHVKGGKLGNIDAAISRSGYVFNRKTGRYFPIWALPKMYRLPIKQLFGPRIPDYLGDKGPIMSRVLAKADTRLHTNIEHELDFELSKL